MIDFEVSYKALNKEQKMAVDTIEGPVMVVAGPGTGKTQVLALRIANILEKTDVGADAILSLTFTRSGVSAMRSRLEGYIGSTARNVHISTFHSFAGDIVQKYYSVLDFDRAPISLDDSQAILLIDELLHDHDWNYIRPRTNPSQYFSDLKGLISILKRERMTPEIFLQEVDKEIENLKQDPESISSRGESKGKIKKEIEKKIESLERTKEVVEFYRLYEEIKKEKGFMDYDDVLEYAVKIVESSDDARDDIRETYQYILIDEHQDSSGVQNQFLKAVWQETEKPNIFVVGDDRQLIYGFSGASLSYFEEFGTLFGKAQLIILIENYRSTERILTLADDLLKSNVAKEKLKSNIKGDHPIFLSEYSYERDEILGAGLFLKEKISKGVKPEECAILLPKNRHVRSAVNILRDMSIPVSSPLGSSLFTLTGAQSLLRVIRIVASPFDSVLLAESLLDKYSNIPSLEAHKALHEFKNSFLDISILENYKFRTNLSEGESAISTWGKKLSNWIDTLSHGRISELVSIIGNELLIISAQNHEELLSNTEIVRSFLHATIVWEEKHPGTTLSEFVKYLSRLEEYGQNVELASFGATSGVQVMTLHRSKGLEYKNVWIAHMNEETLMNQKRQAFTLPESVKAHINERDSTAARRELYVAITRAKEACTISYSEKSYDGKSLELASMIVDLPQTHFILSSAQENENILLSSGPQIYTSVVVKQEEDTVKELKKYVKQHYESIRVSVTLLNNFFSCPWKWYFRNFLKLPEVKSVSLALGSAVHSTIEFILKQSEKPSIKDLDEKINRELSREGIIDQKELKRLSKDAKSAINNWMEEYYSDLAKDKISERSVSFRDPLFTHLQMYGKIDLTERFPNGDISVTDFKTGGVKTSGVIEKITEEDRLSDLMRQLVMYSYLIKGAEKGTTVTSSRLLFVEADKKDKNKLYETHITESKIDLLIRDIKEYDDQLKSGEWVNRECYHKGYGDKLECEYCNMAKIFKKQ
ncbi:MAG: ATP-dependent helicase [Candidatus Pacebacteria bacterium]|nr:ATP-dependent helicase [Candidatus Paceibacterota bacterium]